MVEGHECGGSRFLGPPLRDVREPAARYSLFPAYDDKLNEAIGKRWRELTAALPRSPAGHVVLAFRLTVDGRIEDLKVADTNVGETYVEPCRKAVLEGVPYDRWPEDMRQIIGRDYRDVRMGFNYK